MFRGNSTLWNRVYPQRLIVAPTGGRFTSIQTAIDSITDASATKPYEVRLMPGVYTGNITMKAYVSVVGEDREACVIKAPTGATTRTVALASNSKLMNLRVEGPALADGGSDNYGVRGTAVDDVVIDRCTIVNSKWNVGATGACARWRITDCHFSSPNPVVVGTVANPATNFFIKNNTAYYSGVGAACQAFMDGALKDSVMSGNSTYIKITTVGEDLESYAFSIAGSGSTIAGNDITIVTVRSHIVAFTMVQRPSVSDIGILKDNRINLVSTHASMDYAAIFMLIYQSDLAQLAVNPFLALNNHTEFTLTSTPPDATLAFYATDIFFEDPAQYPTSTNAIVVDKKSVGYGLPSLCVPLVVKLVGRNRGGGFGTKSAAQYLLNVDAAATDSLDIGFTVPDNPVDTTGFAVAPARCLQVACAAQAMGGTFWVMGYEANGLPQFESFTLANGATRQGAKPFKQINRRIGASLTGTPTVDIGTNDLVQVAEGLQANGDVIAVSKNWAAPVAPGTVNAANGTVSLATVIQNDDFAIFYFAGDD